MNSAIIVAAGKGTRMGPGIDKIFLEIAGQPLIAHTWRIFEVSPEIHEIILVVREGMEAEFEKIARECGFAKPCRLVPGGKERQDSVWNGLKALSPETELVAIHDGARPCATQRILADTMAAARRVGAAVAAQRVTDTLKEAGDGAMIERNVDRSRLWAVQTPQVFRVESIRRALCHVFEKKLLVTDDTAACELIGQPVQLVETTTANPKATSPADIPLLELLLRRAPGDALSPR